MSRRQPIVDDESRIVGECRAMGMRPEVWPRTFVAAVLAYSNVEVIVSPLLNGPGADRHVFERGPKRLDDSWLPEWDEPEEDP